MKSRTGLGPTQFEISGWQRHNLKKKHCNFPSTRTYARTSQSTKTPVHLSQKRRTGLTTKFENHGPVWTRTKKSLKIWESQTGTEPDQDEHDFESLWPDQKNLKFSDQVGPVGLRTWQSVDPWLWIMWKKNSAIFHPMNIYPFPRLRPYFSDQNGCPDESVIVYDSHKNSATSAEFQF